MKLPTFIGNSPQSNILRALRLAKYTWFTHEPLNRVASNFDWLTQKLFGVKNCLDL